LGLVLGLLGEPLLLEPLVPRELLSVFGLFGL